MPLGMGAYPEIMQKIALSKKSGLVPAHRGTVCHQHPKPMCGRGEIGKHNGLKIRRLLKALPVQARPSAPPSI